MVQQRAGTRLYSRLRRGVASNELLDCAGELGALVVCVITLVEEINHLERESQDEESDHVEHMTGPRIHHSPLLCAYWSYDM